MARKVMDMPMFEMPEYPGRVDPHLMEMALSNSNLSGEYYLMERNHAEMHNGMVKKDFLATIEHLHEEGHDTAAFFLEDEMKRFF